MSVNNTLLTDITNNADGSRYATLNTRCGQVTTPTFMPDGTRGAVKGMTPDQVASTGVQVMLANTYHLHLQPGESTISKLGGIHGFSKWSGPILTDSGGFQIFSLCNLREVTEEGVRFKHPITGEVRMITPEKSIQIQIELGADMIVAFDHLTGLSKKDEFSTLDAYERTHRWLDRCVNEFKRLTSEMDDDQKPILFGVVQGGIDKRLRKKSLEIVQSSDVGGIAIGGLSVGETKAEMYGVLELLQPYYDDSARPRFLLGVGDPPDIRYAIEHGIDMLDCVMPTRNARHATVWVGDEDTIDKKIHLTNARFIDDPSPLDSTCDCYTCSFGYSKGFLRHQFKVKEPLAGTLCSIHNLRYLTRICEGYRN